jgi:hypothetical protein
MKYLKVGLSTLVRYLLLSTFIWLIVEAFSRDISEGLLIITSVLSIVLWYEGIKASMEQSILEGIITTLFFIIPYGVSIIVIYDCLFYGRPTFFRIPIEIFHHFLSYPLTINYVFVEYKYFSIFEPFLIIISILMLNIINKMFKSIKRKKYQ